jgi:F-type H+-transporting ATPase subunit b
MAGTDAKTVILSLVLNLANILILFVILRALVYKPVKKFMAARAGDIRKQLDDAGEKLKEADGIKEKCRAELTDASRAANEERRRILDAADLRAQEITEEAKAEAERIKQAAALKASHTADQMMAEMREKVADLAIEIAGQVIEREVSKSDNTDIIEKYFDRVG